MKDYLISIKIYALLLYQHTVTFAEMAIDRQQPNDSNLLRNAEGCCLKGLCWTQIQSHTSWNI